MSTVEVQSLLSRARSGDVTALTALAKRMLVGDGIRQAPAEAVAMLRTASSQGSAEAAAQLSVCAAWGVGQSRQIEEAIDQLARAAELGWTAAQRELQLLARAPGNDWAALRRGVNVATLTTPPPVRAVSDRPRIMVVDNFASEAECAWLVARGRPALSRALVYRGSANARAVESRTNTEMGFTIFHADVMLNLIRERMAGALKVSTTFFEITKLLHYEPGEQFGLHADFLQTNTPELVKEVELRGQRSTTFLTYLNSDYEGGETEFPRINFRFKGNRGDALVFSNLDLSGSPDYATVHAGLATISGEKWLLSQWVRTKPVG